MSSGVALHSRLVISALTITLLPEPVAPAISRWGILARSTAIALPATSRPSANVSVEPEPRKSTSSRIRRSATTLNSLFGTSMPTALLPGIGASIRMLRAARAMDRSSDSASIRLTLMCGAGWTSYCVTTGPALRPTIRASMSKLLSFSMIRASFHVWTASAVAPAAAVGSSLRSSSSVGGSTQAIASRFAGESAASVTSSGSRTAIAAAASAGAPTPAPDPPGLRGGAIVAERRRRRLDAEGHGVIGRGPAPHAGLAGRVHGRDARRLAALARRVGHDAHAGDLGRARIGGLRGHDGVGRPRRAVLERGPGGSRGSRRRRHQRARAACRRRSAARRS